MVDFLYFFEKFPTGEVLRDEIVEAVVLVEFVDVDNVGVVEALENVDLAAHVIGLLHDNALFANLFHSPWDSSLLVRD